MLGELVFDGPVVLWVHETAAIGTVRGAEIRGERGERPNCARVQSRAVLRACYTGGPVQDRRSRCAEPYCCCSLPA